MTFRPYQAADRDACLALFDANCPAFFAPNERGDYAAFLADGGDYHVALSGGRIVGAEGRVPRLHIAASHRSAPFFARFGSQTVKTTPNGWGPGMDRVDMVLRLEDLND